MNQSSSEISSNARVLPNGPVVAAILGAGIGCFALSVLAIIADRSAFFQHHMLFYKPTGPLSGVTTTAIIAWLLVWGLLHARWRICSVAAGRFILIALVLLALSLLLTFPPFANLL